MYTSLSNNVVITYNAILFVHISSDTIQLIISERKSRYCLFCLSYRGTDSVSNSNLKKTTRELENQGALMWDIKLGAIEKDSVNCLIAETLVSLKAKSLCAKILTWCIRYYAHCSFLIFNSACLQQ